MSTAQAPNPLTVDELMSALQELPPGELLTFTRRFKTWRARNGSRVKDEALLLACIKENSRLPPPQHWRYKLQLQHAFGVPQGVPPAVLPLDAAACIINSDGLILDK